MSMPFRVWGKPGDTQVDYGQVAPLLHRKNVFLLVVPSLVVQLQLPAAEPQVGDHCFYGETISISFRKHGEQIYHEKTRSVSLTLE